MHNKATMETSNALYKAGFVSKMGKGAGLANPSTVHYKVDGEDRFAIGGARVAGMSTEITWDSNRQCWLILPRIFAGLGKVYPFCAGELRITD